MATKITPHNNEWNRKYNFTDDSTTGFLIEIKNGMAHFAWKFEGNRIKYFKCEQTVFEKSFSVSDEIISHKIEEGVVIHYLRYPIEK